jgi:hypothetical protein
MTLRKKLARAKMILIELAELKTSRRPVVWWEWRGHISMISSRPTPLATPSFFPIKIGI